MFIILETIQDAGKNKFIAIMDEEGFVLTFSLKDQAEDYVASIPDETVACKIVEV